jgi:hypothetical protein
MAIIRNKNITERPSLTFVTFNLGIILGLVWAYVKEAIPLSILAPVGLILLVVANGLLLLLFKRIRAAKR